MSKHKTDNVKCPRCDFWVCTNETELKGFCVLEDLYTYTMKNNCKSFEEGEYMLVSEFENTLYAKPECQRIDSKYKNRKDTIEI